MNKGIDLRSGIWISKLSQGVLNPWDVVGQLPHRIVAYLREHADSPSAMVAYARILVSHAWTYRGSGWGRVVFAFLVDPVLWSYTTGAGEDALRAIFL